MSFSAVFPRPVYYLPLYCRYFSLARAVPHIHSLTYAAIDGARKMANWKTLEFLLTVAFYRFNVCECVSVSIRLANGKIQLTLFSCAWWKWTHSNIIYFIVCLLKIQWNRSENGNLIFLAKSNRMTKFESYCEILYYIWIFLDFHSHVLVLVHRKWFLFSRLVETKMS